MAASCEIHPVTPERWDDLAALFTRPGPRGGRSAPGWCWCMWWRDRSHDADRNRGEMQAIVESGGEPGLLAYVDGEPSAWLALAPRAEYDALLSSPSFKPRPPDDPADRGVYSIVCFFVHPTAQRLGLARQLVRAAIDDVRRRGGTAVEAYPAQAARGTSSQDFMGARAWFEDAGFEVIGKAGRSKVRVRYTL